MAELVLDIHLALSHVALARQRDPTRVVAEMSRLAAEEQCFQRRATLRHPDPREVNVRHATDPTTGDDVLLVGTRWLADGPEQT